MIYVGIDPGLDGGIVALEQSPLGHIDILLVEPMPTEPIGTKRIVSCRGVAKLLQSTIELRPSLVVLEQQSPHPKDGKVSAFKTGRCFGMLEGILSALGYPRRQVQPREWQQVLNGIEGQDSKDRAVLLVGRELPKLNLMPGRRSKPHLGLSDAAAMALWGIRSVRSGEYAKPRLVDGHASPETAWRGP